MLKTIIFDLDGVLLESTEVKTRAFRSLFADAPDHLAEIAAYHEANGGVPRFDKFRYIYAEILRAPLSAERFATLCERYSELCLAEVLAVPLVAGAEAFLRDYHRALSLFVASGTPEDELKEVLDRRGLARYFHGAFGSPASKAEIVGRVLAGWSLEPADTLLVGDSEADLQAAHQYGVPFIGRLHPGSPASWRARPGLITVTDLTELRERVEPASRSVWPLREAAR